MSETTETGGSPGPIEATGQQAEKKSALERLTHFITNHPLAFALIAVGTVLVLFLLWAAAGAHAQKVWGLGGESVWPSVGELGDFFAPVAAGITAVGMLLTAGALFLQRQQLEFQRQEMELTRRQSEAAVNAFLLNERAARQEANRQLLENEKLEFRRLKDAEDALRERAVKFANAIGNREHRMQEYLVNRPLLEELIETKLERAVEAPDATQEKIVWARQLVRGEITRAASSLETERERQEKVELELSLTEQHARLLSGLQMSIEAARAVLPVEFLRQSERQSPWIQVMTRALKESVKRQRQVLNGEAQPVLTEFAEDIRNAKELLHKYEELRLAAVEWQGLRDTSADYMRRSRTAVGKAKVLADRYGAWSAANPPLAKFLSLRQFQNRLETAQGDADSVLAQLSSLGGSLIPVDGQSNGIEETKRQLEAAEAMLATLSDEWTEATRHELSKLP